MIYYVTFIVHHVSPLFVASWLPLRLGFPSVSKPGQTHPPQLWHRADCVNSLIESVHQYQALDRQVPGLNPEFGDQN